MGIGNADGGFCLLKNKYNGIFVKKPGIPGFFCYFLYTTGRISFFLKPYFLISSSEKFWE